MYSVHFDEICNSTWWFLRQMYVAFRTFCSSCCQSCMEVSQQKDSAKNIELIFDPQAALQ